MMAQNASMVLDQNEIELARSPFSYYGIDDKYVQKNNHIFCANCDKIEQERKTFKICLKCKQLGVEKWEPLYHHYCSKTCQIEHWRLHRDEHIQYEKAKIRQYNLDGSFGTESEEQKSEREDTLPNDPVPNREEDGNEPCDEVEKLCKTKMDGSIVLMCDRATSPMSEDTGLPDKVEFNISAGTSSAKFCLGKKIVKSEGCVETSMVELLKQETTPDGTISATATPVYEEIVIYAKNVWEPQVPMGKNPSKDIELRGKKKDSATSPPQKGDLKAPKGSKKTANQLKSTRKGGRGSAKTSRTPLKEETVADVSDVPSKVSSEPFWKPKNYDSKALPAPPSGSDTTPAKAPAPPSGSAATPAKAPAPPSGSAATPAEQVKQSPKPKPDVAKAIAKSKPKKKKDHEVKDVASLSNKYVTVVDVNECAPLEPKHYETDDSSSGSDVGGYMMYILTDETDGTRSAVVQKRKDKHKEKFNPRLLFEKEHVKKTRAIPRKDGKPRQEVTFHFSHPSDEEEENSSGGSSSGAERKAITSSSSNTNENSTSTSASRSAAAKPKNVSAGSETDKILEKANKTADEKSNAVDTKSENRVSKKPIIQVSYNSESPTKVYGDTKPKFDPLPGLHSVCRKINKAFAEEMPRSSQIIEVTVSDDEIEQNMFQKSSDYIDKLFSGKLEKPKKKKGKKRAAKPKGAKNDPQVLKETASKSAEVDNKTSSDVAKNVSPAVETTAGISADQENAKTVKNGALSETGMASGSVDVNQNEGLEASKSDPPTHEKTAIKSVDNKSKDTAAAVTKKSTSTSKKGSNSCAEKSDATSEAKPSSIESNEQASTSVGLLNTPTEGLGISTTIPSPKTPESTVKLNGNGNNNWNSQSPHINAQTSSEEEPSKSVSVETTKSLKHEKTESRSESSILETKNKTGSNDVFHEKTTDSSVKSMPLDGATPSNSVTTISEKPQADESSEDTDKKSITGDSPLEEQAGSKVKRNKFWDNERIGRAQETEHYLAELACLQGPAINQSKDSLDSRNFVLEKAAYAGQDIKVAIVRTRNNKDHKEYDELADTCALKYYVSRKIKIAPVTETEGRKEKENHASFFRGKGGIILKRKKETLDGQKSKTTPKNTESANLDGSTLSEKKENAEIPNKEKPELYQSGSSSDATSAMPSSKVPIVEYDMSSQSKPPADFMSTGKFKVLNSDKEFDDIYSDESISQLSNPSMDVTRIFSPKDEPLNEAPPLDYGSKKSLKPMSEKPLGIPPGGAEKMVGSASKEDCTTSENVASQKQTVATSQPPNIKTVVALKRGQFGFGVETVGEYRVFTHLYAKKRWITEEIEECGNED